MRSRVRCLAVLKAAPADVIGKVVMVMRIATGEGTKTLPFSGLSNGDNVIYRRIDYAIDQGRYGLEGVPFLLEVSMPIVDGPNARKLVTEALLGDVRGNASSRHQRARRTPEIVDHPV
jgi:hypothetical protein